MSHFPPLTVAQSSQTLSFLMSSNPSQFAFCSDCPHVQTATVCVVMYVFSFFVYPIVIFIIVCRPRTPSPQHELHSTLEDVERFRSSVRQLSRENQLRLSHSPRRRPLLPSSSIPLCSKSNELRNVFSCVSFTIFHDVLHLHSHFF